MGIHISKEKGAILVVVWPIEKHCESLLWCTQQNKINNGINVTAAADCIAPDWPVSH